MYAGLESRPLREREAPVRGARNVRGWGADAGGGALAETMACGRKGIRAGARRGPPDGGDRCLACGERAAPRPVLREGEKGGGAGTAKVAAPGDSSGGQQ